MFGFYDPASLEVAGRKAAINFIKADDGEVTRIDINDSHAARQVARSLEGQKRYGISARHGTIREIRGSIAFLPDHPDEALIAPDEKPERNIPLKMAFDVESGDIPRNGYAILHGAPSDGAVMVCKLAMKSYDHVPAAPQAESAGSNGPA